MTKQIRTEAREILGTAWVDGKPYPIVEYLGLIPVDASGRRERVCVVQTREGDRYVVDTASAKNLGRDACHLDARGLTSDDDQ